MVVVAVLQCLVYPFQFQTVLRLRRRADDNENNSNNGEGREESHSILTSELGFGNEGGMGITPARPSSSFLIGRVQLEGNQETSKDGYD